MAEVFFQPYRRVVPMHTTLIFGAVALMLLPGFGITTTLPVLGFFLIVKMYADVMSHIMKHAGPVRGPLSPDPE